MKLLNIFTLLMISIVAVSCSNKEITEPNSIESEILNRAGLTEFDGQLRSHRGLEHGLLAALDLTDEQKEQIKAIVQSHKEAAMAAHRSFQGKADRDERQAKRQQLHETIKAEIAKILTPEQQDKLAALKVQLDNGVVPDELVDLHIERLDEKLDLTDDQKQQLKALDTWAKLIPNGKSDGFSRELRQEKREAFKEHKQKMENILTTEQQAILQEMHGSRKERGRRHLQELGKGRAEKRIQHLAVELDLSASQQQQLEEIFAEVGPGLKAELHGQRGEMDREEVRQAMRQRIMAIGEQIKSILNEEQLKKYEELKTARRERSPKQF